MYSQMKSLACRFKSSYQSIFKQVGELLEEIQRATAEKIEKIGKRIEELKDKLTDEAREEAERLRKEKEKLQREFQKYKVRTIMLSYFIMNFAFKIYLNWK